MTKLRILLVCLLLALAGVRVDAALFGGGEGKAFEGAKESFRLKMWDRAEKDFAEFVEKYPKSENLSQALLWQAQAEFEQKKYDAVVSLLTRRQADAGERADQYLYWVGQAQLAGSNYASAAVTFGKLARGFPASPLRLEAAVNEAAAFAKLGEWAQVTNLLRRADGAFWQAKLTANGGEMLARGFLLLAEAQLALEDFPSAEWALTKVGGGLSPDLEWKRRYLLCRTLAESGHADEAARESEGMITAAENALQNPDRLRLIADSVVFRADLLEQLGRKDEAIATLRRNLVADAPVARQRQALVRVTALAIQQSQLDEALKTLEEFLRRNQETNQPADVAWLTLGEIHLKLQVGKLSGSITNGAATNHLAEATNSFQRVIKSFPGSAYVGKAYLDLGWCYWLENRFEESEGAFDLAVKRLPVSEDRAVALFKLADAQFVRSNYPAALANYREVLAVATNWPAVNGALRTPASYQTLRVSLALTNAVGAEQAVREILSEDSASEEAISGVLLVAQAYLDAKQPVEAQRLFGDFAMQFPESELRPEVELLVARLQEERGEWSKAAAAYDAWLARYATNRLRAQVEFQRALAAAGVGEETNALQRFTNFVAQYPANDLASRAQWWVADYYYGHGVFAEAEIQYKQLFQTWKTSPLAYEARMMAGRAAVRWGKWDNAIEHFMSLTSNTNCPAELQMQALFARGGALMLSAPASTNKLEKWEEARQVFLAVTQLYPTNELTAAAWGEIGNCALQMAATDPTYYNAASNAYQKAIGFPGASGAVRSQSQVGLAIVFEKQAALVGGATATDLLKQGRELYRDVYLGKPEPADGFWRRKAGWDAARLSELLNEWPQALELYRDMLRQKLLPADKDKLEAKINKAEEKVRANGKIDGAAI